MKKVFYFIAVLALMGTMAACGESVSKTGVTSKNEIKDGDSDVMKLAKMIDQQMRIVEQEPSAEGYEALMTLQGEFQLMGMKNPNIDEKELDSIVCTLNDEYAKQSAIRKKAEADNEKWQKWTMDNQAEAQKVSDKVGEKIRAKMMKEFPMPEQPLDSLSQAQVELEDVPEAGK